MAPTRRATLLALVVPNLAAPALLRRAAHAAEAFPTRPVTLVTASAPGGPTDVLARLVAEGMGADLGQPVVVENVPGSVVPAGRVAQAAPDGSTLLINNIGFAASATLYRHLPYEVPDSFAPLGLVSEAAMVVTTRPDFPAPDLSGLLAEIKRQGDKLSLATSGLGSASQLCGMLLQREAGAAMTAVGYRGSAPAVTEVLAGRIDVFCDQATSTLNYLREGKIKGYAVTGPARVPGLETLPTTAEAGHPALAIEAWHGLYAPRGTPDAVQDRLSRALRAALATDGLRRRFAELVTLPAPPDHATPAFHRRFLAEEVARWRPVIQAAGMYAD